LPRALLQHQFIGILGAIKYTEKIKIEGVFPIIEIGIAAFPYYTRTGVVENQVDAVVLRDNFSQYELYFILLGNIQLFCEDVVALCPGGCCLCFGQVDIGTKNNSTGPGEFVANRPANARAAAGYQRDLILKVIFVFESFWG